MSDGHNPLRVKQIISFLQEKAVQAVALSTLVGSFMSAGNAAAATELGQIAAGDNRIGAIALLFAPAIGWVRVSRWMHVCLSICTSLRLALGRQSMQGQWQSRADNIAR